MTHTYVLLEVSPDTFHEIADRLKAAGYDHAFDGDVIDMHGLAVRTSPNMESVSNLPLWQSHKRVRADRIVRVAEAPAHMQELPDDDAGLRLRLECGAVIKVTKSLIARGTPAVGDFYVLYDDGYESWSPAKAFDDGYTRVTAEGQR